ncbi:hypothetical protein CR513_08356, partial [Mucuna pruriens]
MDYSSSHLPKPNSKNLLTSTGFHAQIQGSLSLTFSFSWDHHLSLGKSKKKSKLCYPNHALKFSIVYLLQDLYIHYSRITIHKVFHE